MVVNKSSSNYQILDSGSLITFDPSSDIRLDLQFDESFGFSVAFSFESSDDGRFDLTQAVEGNTITFHCRNFNDLSGTGTTRSIELATYHHKKIYINFWVFPLGVNSLRKLEYNIFIEV